ncbi:Scr1 family TA system antitoxin-like transcriptional regulator [Streptosporangium sp. LJ11]|uniref:Scr1 family TA system antitoxin-like transcriptional regulator n=1 Tax=Streptosporangium sp. LJ11 TaxID=3436927 RepID=UPI003F7AD256
MPVRRTSLSRPDAPDLLAVVDEGVVRRPTGGHELMRDRLQALLNAACRPNVTIRVLPYGVGEHAGLVRVAVSSSTSMTGHELH